MATMFRSRPPAFNIEMSRSLSFWGGLVALAFAIVAWRIYESSRPLEIPFETANRPPAPAPMCPWREPEHDLKLFFPKATRYELKTCILSGQRLELAERLGRTPTGDENALHIYPVYHDHTPLGAVLTRRVKGEFGAIELVLAVNTNQQVCGLRLQRLREPLTSAAALQDSRWLHSFNGKRAEDASQFEGEISGLPAGARVSAAAIADGVRSLLILLAAAGHESSQVPAERTHH